MSKNNRGKSLRDVPSRGRGECPLCKRTSVKVLFEQEDDGKKIKICKICKAAIKNGKIKLAVSKEQPAVSKEQPAVSKEPAAASEEPAAASEEPATASEEPADEPEAEES